LYKLSKVAPFFGKGTCAVGSVDKLGCAVTLGARQNLDQRARKFELVRITLGGFGQCVGKLETFFQQRSRLGKGGALQCLFAAKVRYRIALSGLLPRP